ncbi:hypothetical protein D3C73_1160260 [compost metagenome]
MQAEDHPDQQPGTGDGQRGKPVVQQLARGFQVFAAGQFEGDGGKARNRGDADHQQHQPGVFVFDLGNAPHVLRFTARGEPDHQEQISPDPGIPAKEYLADDRIGRRQNAHRDAEGGGGRQARVGVGEVGHEGIL